MMPTAADPPGTAKPEPWARSSAKELLWKLLLDDASYVHAAGMDIQAIYDSDPRFKQYRFANFKTNFVNLMKKVELEKAANQFDQAAFDKEKEKFARPGLTQRGYKFWNGHAARDLMKLDVTEKRTDMKPSELQKTRPEYGEFPLAVFRRHKYQEEKKQRENVFWQKKRNDMARKRHEKFMRNHHQESA
jgi:hypothetical protein